MDTDRPVTVAAGQVDRGQRWVSACGVAVIAAMATLVRAFVAVKLAAIVLFLLGTVALVRLGRLRIVARPRLFLFYFVVASAGAFWAAVGIVRNARHLEAITDGLRLYVLWSAGFLVLYSALRALPSLEIMHRAMVAAGIVVPMINLVGLCDQLFGLGLIPEWVRVELELQIGFGAGHAQYASANLISAFVFAPYLVVLHLRSDARAHDTWVTKLATVLSLALVAVSGRRALWLVVALTPCTVLALSAVSGTMQRLRPGARRGVVVWTAAAFVGAVLLFGTPEGSVDLLPLARIREAFAAQDERSIQAPFLLDAFANAPTFGSGFGGFAGYIRNEEGQWKYELTYHLLLFNTGIVGVMLLVLLYGSYFGMVTRLLGRFARNSAIPFALTVAVSSLLVGAYSNPYLGGFDSLFFTGLLPFLSTFDRGFEEEAC